MENPTATRKRETVTAIVLTSEQAESVRASGMFVVRGPIPGGGSGYHDGVCCEDGSILVARASVTVLPVTYRGRLDSGVRPAILVENCADPLVWFDDGGPILSALPQVVPIDPPPVPGRDFLIVVTGS